MFSPSLSTIQASAYSKTSHSLEQVFSETQLMRQQEVPAMDQRPKKPSDTRMQHQLSSSYQRQRFHPLLIHTMTTTNTSFNAHVAQHHALLHSIAKVAMTHFDSITPPQRLPVPIQRIINRAKPLKISGKITSNPIAPNT